MQYLSCSVVMNLKKRKIFDNAKYFVLFCEQNRNNELKNMKKILLIAVALVFAVSCSNWNDDDQGTVATKVVSKLHMGDGSEVSFVYGSNGFVSRIDKSDGTGYSLRYDGVGDRDFVINISDGNSERSLIVESGYVKNYVEGHDIICTFDYEYYGNVYLITNNAALSKSSYSWLGSYVLLPMSQSNTWYDDEMMTNAKVAKSISYNWGGSSQVSNVYANINLLPLVVPEYVECSDIDPLIFAGLGALRTYYLPAAVTVSNSRESLSSLAETRNFYYDCDVTGYVQAVYETTSDERKLLFSVEYVKVSGDN